MAKRKARTGVSAERRAFEQLRDRLARTGVKLVDEGLFGQPRHWVAVCKKCGRRWRVERTGMRGRPKRDLGHCPKGCNGTPGQQWTSQAITRAVAAEVAELARLLGKREGRRVTKNEAIAAAVRMLASTLTE